MMDTESLIDTSERRDWFWFDDQNKILRSNYISIPRPGILLAFVTTIAYATNAPLAKLASENVGPGEVIAIRYIMSGAIMAIPMILNQSSMQLTTMQWITASFGGLIGGASTFLSYTAFESIPLMDSITLFNVQSAFVIILAAIFLGEKLGLIEILAIIIMFTGVVFICQPTMIFGLSSSSISTHSWVVGTVCGLLCAFTKAVSAIICRRIKVIKFYVLTFLFSVYGVLLSILVTSVFGSGMPLPTRNIFGTLLGIGILASISKSTLTLAYQYDDATPVTMIQSLEIPLSFFFQWIFFGDRPNLLKVFAAILVIVGVAMSVLKERIKLVFFNNVDRVKYLPLLPVDEMKTKEEK